MLSSLLSKEDCAKCRMCCKFDSYDIWQTPIIYQTLASKILQEYSPDIRFVKRDEHFLMKMQREEEADIYSAEFSDISTVLEENILKFIRIDYVRRLTYNDYELPYLIQKMEPVNPDKPTMGFQPSVDENGQPVMIHGRRRIAAWGRNGVKITFRFAL